MRRMATVGVLIGVSALVVRVRGAELHNRLMAHCEAIFERMPDTFPPKKMMRGIEEIRVTSTRILELLEADKEEADKRRPPDAASGEAVRHGAEQRDKELAAIGASIGANCRPCIEHHLAAGREAGLSPAELDGAVATAQALRRQAVHLLAARIGQLLGHAGPPPEPTAIAQTSKAGELVALGVSVGANSHALLNFHVGAALDVGLEVHQIKSTLKLAGYVEKYAARITADEVARALATADDRYRPR